MAAVQNSLKRGFVLLWWVGVEGFEEVGPVLKRPVKQFEMRFEVKLVMWLQFESQHQNQKRNEVLFGVMLNYCVVLTGL